MIRGCERIRPVLTFLKAEQIRKRAAAGEKQSALAEQFGVSPSEISKIIARSRFKNDIEAKLEERRVQEARRMYKSATRRYGNWKRQRKKEQAKLNRLPRIHKR